MYTHIWGESKRHRAIVARLGPMLAKVAPDSTKCGAVLAEFRLVSARIGLDLNKIGADLIESGATSGKPSPAWDALARGRHRDGLDHSGLEVNQARVDFDISSVVLRQCCVIASSQSVVSGGLS